MDDWTNGHMYSSFHRFNSMASFSSSWVSRSMVEDEDDELSGGERDGADDGEWICEVIEVDDGRDKHVLDGSTKGDADDNDDDDNDDDDDGL